MMKTVLMASAAIMILAGPALARSELESATIKAASDCVAAAALNNPDIEKLYRRGQLKQVTDWIVLKSSACDNQLKAMRLLHDQLYGPGTGHEFLMGDYLADLPRAVGERIKDQVGGGYAQSPQVPPEPAPASPSTTPNPPILSVELPSCSDAAVLRRAFLIGYSTNRSVVDLVIPIESAPMGADKRFSRKTCRVTYRCAMQKAKEMESGIYGSHPISAACYVINQRAEAGNPPSMEFALEPNGEGGTIITAMRANGGF